MCLSMGLFFVFIFLFGLIIGSFLNVVVLRYNTGKNFLHGRSLCFSCGKHLRWFELLPVISFLIQRGRCSSCKARISWQYPAVEFLTGVVFLLYTLRSTVLLGESFLTLFFGLFVWAILIALSVYDIRHMIIPDSFLRIFISLVLFRYLLFLNQGVVTPDMFYNAIISGLIVSIFFFFLWAVSNGRWIGFGDVKLSFGLVFSLGLPQGLSAVAFAFWSGALYALSKLFLARYGFIQLSGGQKTVTIKSEVPFGPFLVLGVFIAYMFNADIFHLSLFNL